MDFTISQMTLKVGAWGAIKDALFTQMLREFNLIMWGSSVGCYISRVLVVRLSG